MAGGRVLRHQGLPEGDVAREMRPERRECKRPSAKPLGAAILPLRLTCLFMVCFDKQFDFADPPPMT